MIEEAKTTGHSFYFRSLLMYIIIIHNSNMSMYTHSEILWSSMHKIFMSITQYHGCYTFGILFSLHVLTAVLSMNFKLASIASAK